MLRGLGLRSQADDELMMAQQRSEEGAGTRRQHSEGSVQGAEGAGQACCCWKRPWFRL